MMLTGCLIVIGWRWSVVPWQPLCLKLPFGVNLRANVCYHLGPNYLCIVSSHQHGV